MMQRLNELHLQRGRLLERITTQRYVLIAEYFNRKASDYDRWIRGMRRMRVSILRGSA